MTNETDAALRFTFEDAEREQLRAWVRLDASQKIDFFEEMIELAYRSGALTPQRLALRDMPAIAKPEGMR
jgi:hypothetical protein